MLLSGGFRSGKTLSAIIKIITQHCTIANNRGLIGRLTYPELRDTVQKDFFELLPEEWIQNWDKTNGVLTLVNGCEVLFRHLDTVSELEIRGMTLGFVFISQVEEIDESVYKALLARLNLMLPDKDHYRQIIMDCNPSLFWAYKYFKQESDTDRELIEFSMLENQENLPPDYLSDMMKQPALWKKQFVFGIWDESLLSDKSVIPVEYIQTQKMFREEPLRLFEKIDIYENMIRSHNYQIGVDVAEGVGQDRSAVECYDLHTGKQVAHWKGQMQPDLLAKMIVIPLARYFNQALVIPEINSVGLTFLSRLKDDYSNIYKRKVFDKVENKETEQLGWRTTYSTKPLMVDNLLTLLREGMIQIKARDVHAEMSTLVYTTESRKHGIGAQSGFHDDCIIATMLALIDFTKNKVTPPLRKLESDNYRRNAIPKEEEKLSVCNF